MRTRVSFVDQIELKPRPNVLLRIGLADFINGELPPTATVQWHRTSFRRDTDVESQMAAVNEHLAQMGEPPISDEEIQRVKRAVEFHMQEFPLVG